MLLVDHQRMVTPLVLVRHRPARAHRCSGLLSVWFEHSSSPFLRSPLGWGEGLRPRTKLPDFVRNLR